MRLFSLCVFVAIAACSKKPSIDATDASVAIPELKPTDGQGLGDVLVFEAQNKNKSDPSTQKVRDAVGKLLTLSAEQQHLGRPIGATHCLGFHTAEHLALSICEYADEKAAEAGAEVSRAAFAAISHRTVHVRRSTTITILENPADESSAAAKKKVLDAFEAL